MLPVFDRLEGGDGSRVKGEILREFAKAELNMLAFDFKQKKLTKEDYMKKVKPYLAVQMKASKLIKTYSE